MEVDSVITSASQNVSGGAVLLRMARLDTAQVRAWSGRAFFGVWPARRAARLVPVEALRYE